MGRVPGRERRRRTDIVAGTRSPPTACACTRATVASGVYPAVRPLGVVARGRPRGALARFLRWATASRKARSVIARRCLPR